MEAAMTITLIEEIDAEIEAARVALKLSDEMLAKWKAEDKAMNERKQ